MKLPPSDCQHDIQMPLPEIDFAKIRPHDGSRHAAFEQLCSQLAFLEDHLTGSEFIRKGSGGDAGVECFVRLPDGSERGWQAKYVFNWDDGLSGQLDSSMKALIEKHPRMTEVTICLPFNLPDSRRKGRKSARRKFEDWKDKWGKKIAKEQRTLSISLWDESRLQGLLATDTPAHAGQVFYWFDTERLTSEWFTEKFNKAHAALGSRYTPETNVELLLRQQFLALARDSFLEDAVREWSLELSSKSFDVLRCLDQANKNGSLTSQVGGLSGALDSFGEALQWEFPDPESDLPLADWKKRLAACRSAVDDALEQAFRLPASKNEDQDGIARAARSSLFRLTNLLGEISGSLDSDTWRLANSRSVLLEGDAGSGKSHLLADVVKHQVRAGRPGMLIPGSAMIEGDPWRQLMQYLDLPGDLRIKHFLGSLDAAAGARSTRAIVCIDAINENHGPDIWPDRLAAFLEEARPFRRVAIVLSCRTAYLAHIIPDSLPEDRLERVVHRGFSDGEAADRYLEMRGIVRPGAPGLMPEFQSPLFLKTLCDALEREGRNEIPHGLRGVSAVFDYYYKATTQSVTRRMKLDPNFNLVPTALEHFTEILLDRRESYAPLSDVLCTFEEILRSEGQQERSLLTQLESEGVLTIEPVQQGDGTESQMVRFTFERYSDHRIAEHLLREHLDRNDVRQSFGSGSTLGKFVFGEKNYRRAGVIEAIAIQLPELANTEIIDVGHDNAMIANDPFLASLLWRRQDCFTDRTLEIARQLLGPDDEWGLLIQIATEPSNRFNAAYLHAELSRLAMPERDATWSNYLNWHDQKNGPVGILIDWAWREGMGAMDEDRARLTAMVLGWFLSSSNRAVRDRTTKALACLFAQRLQLARETLLAFADVDDLYVRERLFAAAYGAALQGKADQGLSRLASTVYELVFADENPPLNELLRDHARGIIRYAKLRGKLASKVDMNLVRPPHKSPWPIEHVPDSTVDAYTVDHDGYSHGDRITMSTVHDGDFARYVIDYIVRHWGPVPSTARDCPTVQFLAKSWIEEFRKSATRKQLHSFDAVKSAAKSLKFERLRSQREIVETAELREEVRVVGHGDTSEKEAELEAAEKAFEASLPGDVWEEYRVTAMNYVRLANDVGSFGHRSARFNSGWARRWVCKRAHELGWTPERFALPERGCNHDRNDHKVERIGKKYQWLALHELVARMADNLLFMGSSYGDEEQRQYRGAHEIEFKLRDIDPSLLTAETHYDGWKPWNSTWWVPVTDPDRSSVTPRERLAWLDSDLDLFNCASLIDLTLPENGQQWLALEGFAHWRQFGVGGGEKMMERDTWYRIRSIVVKKEDRKQAIQSLKGQILIDPHAMPSLYFNGSCYLGEYRWHPSAGEFEDWTTPESSGALIELPVPFRPTTVDYRCERGGYDYSVDETIEIAMLAPWLAGSMALTLQDGRNPVFVDSSGQTRFYDTSLAEPGFSAALVDKGAFLTVLQNLGLAAIWVIAGEKGVFGSRNASGMGFGGRIEHTGVYTTGRDLAVQNVYQIHRNHQKPDPAQLNALFDGESPPEIAAKYATST